MLYLCRCVSPKRNERVVPNAGPFRALEIFLSSFDGSCLTSTCATYLIPLSTIRYSARGQGAGFARSFATDLPPYEELPMPALSPVRTLHACLGEKLTVLTFRQNVRRSRIYQESNAKRFHLRALTRRIPLHVSDDGIRYDREVVETGRR